MDDEVRRDFFAMNTWKAAGPDGYLAGFYQKSWEVVGKSVCDFVKKVWCNFFSIERLIRWIFT